MRLLILAASTGGGHLRASRALNELVLSKDPSSKVEIVDCLEYVSHSLNRTVSGGYEQMAKKTPMLYGAIYKQTNKENTLNNMATQLTQHFARKLLPLLASFRPDAVVATHALASEMMSTVKKKYNIDIPLVTIITDFAPHRMYIQDNVSCYITASEDTAQLLENMGVSKNKIRSFGTPIDSSFYNEFDREKELAELGFDKDKPTLLLMAGSFGVTDILKIYAAITNIDLDFQIIVITGKNEKLYSAFEQLLQEKQASPSKRSNIKKAIRELNPLSQINPLFAEDCGDKPTKLLFFTNEVQKYMHISDLIVTKPGGLTVSEALACSLPMAIFKAIPGQEEENCEFLVKNNVAVRISKNDCAEKIASLIKDPQALTQMKENCKKVYKDKSAENLFSLLQELVNNNGR